MNEKYTTLRDFAFRSRNKPLGWLERRYVRKDARNALSELQRMQAVNRTLNNQIRDIEHERDVALQSYENAMHRVAELETELRK